MPLIRHLEISRYRSTKAANEKLTRLAQASGWPDHVVSRLALSRSLQLKTRPDVVPTERKGKELRGETFFHSKHDSDYLPWVAAMIAQHNGCSYTSDDEAAELVLAHLHRGLDLLCDDLDQKEGRFVDVVVSLARESGDAISATTQGAAVADRVTPLLSKIRPIEIPIGQVEGAPEPFSVTINDTRRFSNCHAAVSGMSGSGKTQLAKQMLATAAQCCDETTGIIFIDFAKGDVAQDSSFVDAIDGQVLQLPGDVLPIGPFHLHDYSVDSITLAAEEKREVYKNLFRSLGPKQQGRLAVAIRESYEDLGNDSEQAPDFAYLQDKLNQVYQREGLQPDSLSELLRQLTAYRLFWSRGDASSPVSPLHTRRWVVDIHELGGLKEVTAFTLIEQLYREMRGLPESQIDAKTGLRHIRCMLAIDEAQYYLKAQNRFLQGIIREGRSKGFAVMLLCQSPDDFDQDDFDYTEQLQFTYMLQCKTEPKAVQRLLGVSRDEAKRLSTQLGRMEPLFGVGRVEGAKLQQFRVVPFFEQFGQG